MKTNTESFPGAFPPPTIIAGKFMSLTFTKSLVPTAAHRFLEWGDYLNITVHNQLKDNG